MAELRWVDEDGKAHCAPTATDALEYAERKLRDKEEMECCQTDARLPSLKRVRKLLGANV